MPGANNFAAGGANSKSANSSPVGDSIPIPGGSGGGSNVKLHGGDKTGSPRHRTSNDAWVCPNDRQLALRAKLVQYSRWMTYIQGGLTHVV